MKIKADFVTNSSSSSFIVFWPHAIESRNDVDQYIKRDDFVEQIFKDAKDQNPFVVQHNQSCVLSIAQELDAGYVEGIYVDYWDGEKDFCEKHGITLEQLKENRHWHDQAWAASEAKQQERCTIKAIEIVKENEGKYAYIFNYADEDGGFFSELEHNNDWGGLPYVRISKH